MTGISRIKNQSYYKVHSSTVDKHSKERLRSVSGFELQFDKLKHFSLIFTINFTPVPQQQSTVIYIQVC